jgi:hypothetical protein
MVDGRLLFKQLTQIAPHVHSKGTKQVGEVDERQDVGLGDDGLVLMMMMLRPGAVTVSTGAAEVER